MSEAHDLVWHRCKRLDGHGVASGIANRDPSRTASPYPRGTLAMQAPLFAEQGLDLSPYWFGTLNLSVAPAWWSLRQPDYHFPNLRWTTLHPPETFSFWAIQLRSLDQAQCWPALVYYPHPETKARHWQPPSVLEVLAPWIEDLPAQDHWQMGVDPSRLILQSGSPPSALAAPPLAPADRIRRRAMLLEFLKFRVLAAQDTFFESHDGQARRAWLQQLHPQALALTDQDLDQVWQQAYDLYGCH